MSKNKPNLIIHALKSSLDAAENSLKEEDHKMALSSFRDIKGVASYAEDILKSMIFQESSRDLIHKPTLDRLGEWVKKYQDSHTDGKAVRIVLDIVLEQIELMKDE